MNTIKTKIAAALTLGLLLTGCSANDNGGDGTVTPPETAATQNAPTSTKTGTFTYAISGDPSSTNAINTGDRWGLTFANIVYEQLARVDATTGKTELVLADSIDTSSDGLTITVKLKPGIKWSDGEALTSADVVFTYNTKAVKDNGAADALWIDGKQIEITALDELTVQFKLPSYSAAAISGIVTETFIIPEHVYPAGTDFSGNELPSYVGSNGYKLDEYKRGEYIKFVVNDNYHGTKPAIANLVLRIVSNADTVKAALQTGEVDAAYVVPAQIPDLTSSPVTVYPYPEGRVAYVGVVVPKVPNEKLRQALFFALDRAQIAKAAWLDPNNYELAYTILPPSNAWATTDVEQYIQDVEKAESLVAESGVANPKLTLGYSGGDLQAQAEVAVIQAEAAAVGITIELVPNDNYYDEIEKGAGSAIDLFIGGYIMGIDPDAYGGLFRSDGSWNYFSYGNADVDAAFTAGAAARTDADRHTAYDKVQRLIAEDAIFYAIADNLKIIAINDRIGGIDQAKLVSIYTFEDFGKLTEK
ncbi:MAG: ABC transporter substrate-binding protein [Propionibacteriaceae bacterium]|jgi:peptide/nickel transport system substrate-binding protein|nr:ABC transporter substrate-binding protein [Propionibacteriaceae bacterium]